MPLKPPSPELLRFIERYSGFYLVSHEEPDGDAIGSQLALGSYLGRKGKEVVLLSPGPWQRKEISSYQNLFIQDLHESRLNRGFGLLVLDCSSLNRTGHFSSILNGFETAVIDHHQPNGAFQGTISYIEPRSPSTTLLIQKVIEALNDTPTYEEARYLFLGFATDTGFFRHLEVEATESLSLISRLSSTGVTPKLIYRESFGNFSLESRFYLAKILSTLESVYGGKLLLTHIRASDYQRFGAEHRQSDPLYQLLLAVEGCEAVVFIREEEEGRTSVSLRSPGNLNVAAIAQGLGGGGHKNASGYVSSLPYEAARDQLIQAFRPYLESPS